ncbi:MAG: PleD family two-component system response regulator [Myxococcales bacterium]
MRSVLIVEKDADTRTTLEETLATEGYTPVAVPASDQAIDYLSTHEPPCLVLLDLDHPEATATLLSWLREQQSLHGLPVVVLSGWRPADRGLAAFREYVRRVIQKPFPLEEVLKTIEEHCGPAARD